jgi:hypothetical protein
MAVYEFECTDCGERFEINMPMAETAHMLVHEYGLIAVEDLNVKGLAGSRLVKSVQDAGCSQFISILSNKAESAGRTLLKVNLLRLGACPTGGTARQATRGHRPSPAQGCDARHGSQSRRALARGRRPGCRARTDAPGATTEHVARPAVRSVSASWKSWTWRKQARSSPGRIS